MDVNAWRSSLGIRNDKTSEKDGSLSTTEGSSTSSLSHGQPSSSNVNSPQRDSKPSGSNKPKLNSPPTNQKPLAVGRQTLIVNTPSPRPLSNIPTTHTPIFIRATSVTAAAVTVSSALPSSYGQPKHGRSLQPSNLGIYKSSQIIRNPVRSSTTIHQPPMLIPHGARPHVISVNSSGQPRLRTTIRYPQGRSRPAAITSYQRHVMLTQTHNPPIRMITDAVDKGSINNTTVAVSIPNRSVSLTATTSKFTKNSSIVTSSTATHTPNVHPQNLTRPVMVSNPPKGKVQPARPAVDINPQLDPFMVIRPSAPSINSATNNGVISTPRQSAINLLLCAKPSTSTVLLQGNDRVKTLPCAIVRPQLTHLIDGFIIEEASEPFPISRSAIVLKNLAEEHCKSTNNTSTYEEDKKEDELLKCEFCGKMDTPNKFKRSKRFCSMACAKRYNVGCSKRLGLFKPKRLNVERLKHNMKMQKRAAPLKGVRVKHGRLAFNTHNRVAKESNLEHNLEKLENKQEQQQKEEEEDDEEEDMDKYDEGMFLDESSNSATLSEGAMSSSTPSEDTSSMNRDISPMSEFEPAACSDKDVEDPPPLSNLPSQWTPHQVSNFINTLPGCTDYANEFLVQEIDGQALLLLKEDHLMTAMNMKLGPALKIISKIHSLKEK